MTAYVATMSLEEYYEGVCQAFQSWVNDHYDLDTWMEQYDSIEYAYENSGGVLENDFIGWNFDWKQAAISYALKNMCGVYCPECDIRTVYEYGDSPECECDGEEHEEMDDNAVAEYMDEMEVTISEWDMESALSDLGFPSYLDALESSHGGVCDTIKGGLERLTEYDDVQDLMCTLLWVTNVYHASGHLLEDRGYDLDMDMVDEVRNNGLNSVWDREEIEEFMESM